MFILLHSLSCLLSAPVLLSAPHEPQQRTGVSTNRLTEIDLPLASEEDAFFFAVFGDRTGGPAEGVRILEQAVADVNLLDPDLVMTVGDLIQGYGEAGPWLEEMVEYKGIMAELQSPWFPVAGNHDVYWRGTGERPAQEHDALFETHFGPLWYAFEHKGSWFIVLYTDEGNPVTGEKTFRDPAAQKLSPEQFAWLDGVLEQTSAAQHVFVFMHHPRWLQGGYGDDWEHVHTRLASAGNVSAVFAGHIHQMRYDGIRDGIEYFTLATVGGGQSGLVPAAGYLHQYHIVTVRPERISVSCFPVGAVMDPRKISGEVVEDVSKLARQLTATFSNPVQLQEDSSLEDETSVHIVNPVARAIELQITPESADGRWAFSPDHEHLTLQPGESVDWPVRLTHTAERFDAAFAVPQLRLQVEYLAEGLRVPLPDRSEAFDLDVSRLGDALVRSRGYLHLDGVDDYVRFEHADLDLPDGAMTVEAWLRPSAFKARQAALSKLESSEFGLMVSGGTPSFLVHLDGAYVHAKGAAQLVAERWTHVAGVFDGAELRLYVDGKCVATTAATGRRTRRNLPLLVGADVDGSGAGRDLYAGDIDEVRVSSSARYSADFTPAERFEADEHTRLLLHLDGIVGPWLIDSGDRASHGVLHGDARVIVGERP